MRVFFLCLASLALAGAMNAQTLSPADIKSLLSKIRERRATAPDVQADFREERTLHLMAKPIVGSGKVWFEAPDKFRRQVEGNSPSLTISDGTQLWIYYPNFKTVEHYSLGKRSPVDAAIAAINTALNLENVENTLEISGARNGDGYDLQLLPRTLAMKRVFQRLDMRLSGELLAERTDMLQPGGDRIVTTYSNQTRAVIPRSTFEFAPPPGTEVTTPLGR